MYKENPRIVRGAKKATPLSKEKFLDVMLKLCKRKGGDNRSMILCPGHIHMLVNIPAEVQYSNIYPDT